MHGTLHQQYKATVHTVDLYVGGEEATERIPGSPLDKRTRFSTNITSLRSGGVSNISDSDTERSADAALIKQHP